VRRLRWTLPALALFVLASLVCRAQAMPATSGETLNGRHVVLADAVRGHAVVLVFGFTKEAGDGCGAWAKAIREDPSLAGVTLYSGALLERVPGFMRGMIKAAMRKGVGAAEQDHFVVLTQDEKLWRNYFGANADQDLKDPYVLLLDSSGQVRWRGHGAAGDMEPLLRSAKR